MSGTRDFNNIETRAVIKFFFCSARQGAEGNSHHSDRNISLFPGYIIQWLQNWAVSWFSSGDYIYRIVVSNRSRPLPCKSLYKYVYSLICTYTCSATYTYIYVYIYSYILKYTYIYVHLLTYADIYLEVLSLLSYIDIYAHTLTYAYIYLATYTYIYWHIATYTHIYLHLVTCTYHCSIYFQYVRCL